MKSTAGTQLLEGPPGVGKSWLAKGIGAQWAEWGGSTVYAEGDPLRGDIAYYPYRYAMSGLQAGWRSLVQDFAGVAQAGESLVGTAGIVTAAVRGISRAKRNRRRRRAPDLIGEELAILNELERLASNRPLLIIADNIHWWDSPSLVLLRELQSPHLSDAFPFLGHLRVLAVRTSSNFQPPANASVVTEVLGASSAHSVKLGRIPEEGFIQVLRELGSGAISPAVAEAVYTVSGGHLAIAAQAARRIAETGSGLFEGPDLSAAVNSLMTERLLALGPQGQQAVLLLQIASLLGAVFRRSELHCASPEANLPELLRFSRDQCLIELWDDQGRFVHDYFRQFFLASLGSDRASIHYRLADCLRQIRPSDYELRARHLVEAEQELEAASVGVLAILQRRRDGRDWQDLDRSVLQAASNKLQVTVDLLLKATEDLAKYRFPECLASLDALPPSISKPLRAEADYIRAMCLFATRSEDDRAIGRHILKSWDGYEEVEPDIGMRLMRLHLYGLTHLVDKEEALAQEFKIRQFLFDRTPFNEYAQDELFSLDRSAGSLYQPEVALGKTRQAVSHFGPKAGLATMPRPTEYYRSLVNCQATLICNAKYQEAIELGSAIRQLVAEYPTTFPRLDYPAMNSLLAEYRGGHVSAGLAARRQSDIIASLGSDSDPFYGQNALAVYHALSGNLARAVSLEAEALKLLTSTRDNPEPNMSYVIRSNLCLLGYLSGNSGAHSSAEWASLLDVVEKIPYTTRHILLRRHHFIGDLLAESVRVTPVELDVLPIRRFPGEVGPIWDNYGRAFRLPEVEIWRDS